MNIRKPGALIAAQVGRRCPICGKASYSQSGTHPQCAANRSTAALRAARKAAEAHLALDAVRAQA